MQTVFVIGRVKSEMMSKFFALIICAGVLFSQASCKTWYKPGGDEESLAADQQHCEQETGESSGTLYMDCLKRAGWGYRDTSAAKDSGSDSASRALLATPAVHQDQTSPVDTPSAGKSGTPPVVTKAGSPGVGSWVQFGVNTGQLESARAQCDETGAGSEAFKKCMQGKGWQPIKFRITVQEPGDLD